MNDVLQKLEAPGIFRLMLALVVFGHHASRFNVGGAAVYIFFVLSGFWIATMWTHKYSRSSSPYTTYSVSRLWRLVPVFSLCSFITWVLLYSRGAIPDLDDPIAHQIFSNIFMLGYNSLSFKANGSAWSLDVETQFYLIAPLLIALSAKSLWTSLACVAVSITAVILNMPSSIISFLAFFGAGIAAAKSEWAPTRTFAWLSFGCSVALIVACLASPFRQILLGGAHPGPLFIYNPIACVVLTILMTPWAIHSTKLKSSTTDSMFGDLSYIVYLLHWPVLSAFHTERGSYIDRGLSIAGAFVVVMAASWIIWRLFDRPINRWRSNWVSRRIDRELKQPRVSTIGDISRPAEMQNK